MWPPHYYVFFFGGNLKDTLHFFQQKETKRKQETKQNLDEQKNH